MTYSYCDEFLAGLVESIDAALLTLDMPVFGRVLAEVEETQRLTKRRSADVHQLVWEAWGDLEQVYAWARQDEQTAFSAGDLSSASAVLTDLRRRFESHLQSCRSIESDVVAMLEARAGVH